MSTRVAVIGCGRMGKERAAAARASGADVIAVADVDAERARELAESAGAQPFASPDELPWNQLDAVFLCTPPSYRIEATWCAAQSATPLLIEKPLALDAPLAWGLVELTRQAKMIAAVGYMNRYRSGVAIARAAARAGPLVGISCNWSGKRYAVPWWDDAQTSGGPINEQATHVIDLCRYIGGEVVEVVALGNPNETRVAAALLFENRAVGTVFYTCEAAEKNISLETTTTAGHIRLHGWDFVAETNTMDGALPRDDVSPFVHETAAFLEAVRMRDTAGIRCTVEDAYRTQLVVDAIRQLAATRKPLSVAG